MGLSARRWFAAARTPPQRTDTPAPLAYPLSAKLPACLPAYLPVYLLLFGLLSVALTVAARSYLGAWQLVHAPLHTVAEASGALAALLLAFTIVVSPERDRKLHPYIVAAALVAMSLLDLAHAAVPVGGLSVWLRSMATLLGGTLFALTWLPPRPLGRPQRRATLAAAVALAVLCAALPMGLAGAPPAMLEGGAFTPLAKAINLAGGLGFLAACLRYCLLYRRQRQTGHLLNANFCFLFGFSGLLLPYSDIWGVAWWYWHVLRLAGYLLILTHILLYIRRTNAALIDSVQTLTTASERLRLATTAGGIGIWDWDAAGDVLLWDAQLYRLYGVAPDSFEATLAGWLARVTPQDRAATRAAFDAALRGEREYAIEFRIDWPDGSQRHIAAAGQAYFGADGRATRMLGVNHDVTAHRVAEQELRRHRDHLEEAVAERTRAWQSAAAEALAASRAKSLFLSNMSHELRTPMNAIIGFSSLMQRDPGLSAGQRQDLAIISRSGEHLLTLINDVLDMAKIEAGRVSLEQRAYDLHALTGELLDLMGERAGAKGLALRLEQAARLPRYLCGDEGKLRQVLINLLGNAVKFTARGGVVLRLDCGGTAAAPLLLIEVEDSGPGIAAPEQPAIFEPFVQAGGVVPQEGTGLGLTITRQFVQLMGGDISVASRLGVGSVFRVALPLVAARAADVAAPAPAPRQVLRVAPGQPAYRILVVEDQAENALLIERLLDGAGFAVKLACDGQAGVEAFAGWRPHFIWMDRRMPNVDGIEACRRIRALPGGAQVKIVGLTASILPEERGELLRAGMDDIVCKPYREEAIFGCMERLLGVRYLYWDDAPAERAAGEPGAALARLAALPPELRAALRQALFDLDDGALAALTGEAARTDAALGAALARHVETSNHSAILQALDLPPQGGTQ